MRTKINAATAKSSERSGKTQDSLGRLQAISGESRNHDSTDCFQDFPARTGAVLAMPQRVVVTSIGTDRTTAHGAIKTDKQHPPIKMVMATLSATHG